MLSVSINAKHRFFSPCPLTEPAVLGVSLSPSGERHGRVARCAWCGVDDANKQTTSTNAYVSFFYPLGGRPQGNITVTGRESAKSLYSADLASMEIEGGGSIDYEPADAQVKKNVTRFFLE